MRGPATAPQPASGTGILDGHVAVRPRRRVRAEDATHDAVTDRHRTGTEEGTTDGHRGRQLPRSTAARVSPPYRAGV
ncbi:hypothetical protein ACI2L5_56430, partial [Streptomyces milbemycinicus]